MFQLDLRNNKSIYDQIVDKFKEQIMMGQLQTGAKMPSVRELSRELGVNPNTIQKAYRELERQGYIYTSSGVGTFVADKKSIVPDEEGLCKAKNAIGGHSGNYCFSALAMKKLTKLRLRQSKKGRMTCDQNRKSLQNI